MIYHYTSVKNLALILDSKKIRFNRLDKVDDLKEIEGLPEGFSTYVFISCWTDECEESIPLWKMYTDNMHGVRISFPIKMFKNKLIKAGDYGNHGFTKDCIGPLSYEETVTDKYLISNVFDNDRSFYKKVIYDNNYPNIYKKNFIHTKDSLTIANLFILGSYKKESWKFENECRFTLYAIPFLPLNHPLINGSREKQFDHISDAIIKNIKMDINYIDIELDEEVLDNISLIAGPLCDNADIFIIDSLLKKYTTNGRMDRSNLSGSIKG